MGVYDGRLIDSEFFCVTYKCHCWERESIGSWMEGPCYKLRSELYPSIGSAVSYCHHSNFAVPSTKGIVFWPTDLLPNPVMVCILLVLFWLWQLLILCAILHNTLIFLLVLTPSVLFFDFFPFFLCNFSLSCEIVLQKLQKLPLDHSHCHFNCWTKKKKAVYFKGCNAGSCDLNIYIF